MKANDDEIERRFLSQAQGGTIRILGLLKEDIKLYLMQK